MIGRGGKPGSARGWIIPVAPEAPPPALAVEAINDGLADLDAGRSVTTEGMRAHFEKRRTARRARKAA